MIKAKLFSRIQIVLFFQNLRVRLFLRGHDCHAHPYVGMADGSEKSCVCFRWMRNSDVKTGPHWLVLVSGQAAAVYFLAHSFSVLKSGKPALHSPLEGRFTKDRSVNPPYR